MAIDPSPTDTFPKWLLHNARQLAESPAIRHKSRGIWQTQTWSELASEVTALAVALSERGLRRGEHVALLGDNRPRLYAATCAAQWLGAVVVPLYPDTSAAEIVPPLNGAEAAFVFAENQEQVDKLLEILPRCPSIRGVFYDNDRGMRHYRQPQLLSYEALLEQGRAALPARRAVIDAELARGQGSDPAALFFLSSASGEGKGVVHSHAALIDRARVAATQERLGPQDMAVAYLPPAWIGQHLFAYAQPWVVGYCISCPESAETMLTDMREVGPTYFMAPPRVLESLYARVSIRMDGAGKVKRALFDWSMALARRVGAAALDGQAVSASDRLAHAAADLLIYGPLRDVLGMSRVRVAIAAGEALGPDLLRFYRSIGINLKTVYGSTETGVIVSMQPDGQIRPDAVGPATQGVELSFGAQREILVRSAGLFLGYHRDEASTREAVNADGWYRTGDAGYLGQDGQLRIVGRLREVGTLRDGTPYSPQAIESKLRFSPYVKEAVAIGDQRDAVCAIVNIDAAAVGLWADKQAISYTGYADLASRDEVYGLIADCIAAANAELARDPTTAGCQVHRFLILHKEFDADDGELTRLRKLRRDVIGERYLPLVEGLYQGVGSVRIDAEVRYEDGRVGTVSADVKIRDAKTTNASPAKKAA